MELEKRDEIIKISFSLKCLHLNELCFIWHFYDWNRRLRKSLAGFIESTFLLLVFVFPFLIGATKRRLPKMWRESLIISVRSQYRIRYFGLGPRISIKNWWTFSFFHAIDWLIRFRPLSISPFVSWSDMFRSEVCFFCFSFI